MKINALVIRTLFCIEQLSLGRTCAVILLETGIEVVKALAVTDNLRRMTEKSLASMAKMDL